MPKLHLYTRRQCGLCDAFVDALEAAQPRLPLDMRDVDADPAWRERFGHDVPVLTDAADRVICMHHFDAAALRAAVA